MQSTGPRFTFTQVSGEFSICRLEARAMVPEWVPESGFVSITRTADELSIVCPSSLVPAGVKAENGWSCLKLEGPIPFEQLGVVAEISTIVAAVGASIFVISTFDTDYLLVRNTFRSAVTDALRAAGHSVPG